MNCELTDLTPGGVQHLLNDEERVAECKGEIIYVGVGMKMRDDDLRTLRDKL